MKEKIDQGIWQPAIFKDFTEVEYGGLTKLFVSNSSQKKFLVIRPKLSHGNNSVIIDKNFLILSKEEQQALIQNTDGLITDLKAIELHVTTADCTAVALFDPEHKAVGIFHSGWRGTAALLVKKGLEKMQATYGTDPERLLVSIGPSIAPEDYEVDTPVYEKFNETYHAVDMKILFIEHAPGKYYLNVPKAIQLQLMRSGVPEENIELSEYFTSKYPYLFPSARKAGGVAHVQPMVFFIRLK